YARLSRPLTQSTVSTTAARLQARPQEKFLPRKTVEADPCRKARMAGRNEPHPRLPVDVAPPPHHTTLTEARQLQAKPIISDSLALAHDVETIHFQLYFAAPPLPGSVN